MSESNIRLIMRVDDFGFCHAANLAFEKCFSEGILTCGAVMVSAPWFEEAAEMCRRNPDWQVGVHSTFTSEWKYYRWGPVLPAKEVPSLVGEDGYFRASTADFRDSNPDLAEVEAELRAQIDKALAHGIDVGYLDHHMGAVRSTPEMLEIEQKVAAEYRIPVALRAGEEKPELPDGIPQEPRWLKEAELLRRLEPGLWLRIVHPGLGVPEMQALRESWLDDGPYIAESRQAQTDAVVATEVLNAVKERGITLVGYREIRDRMRADGEL
jgi:predicted glycoside hydrolase/deacetylase ChbG (UPF0249 family)